MIKKLLKAIIIILMIIGIGLGISITVKRESNENSKTKSETNIYKMIQTKTAEATNFYTYGKAFNISGRISNISKDNFESAKLVITDGNNFQENYPLNTAFEDDYLVFSSDNEINSGIIIDKLYGTEYYILLRLKLNNGIDPKYYSFINKSGRDNITYYTVTKDGKNKEADIAFQNTNYNNKEYNLLKISLKEKVLPDDVYDIVIDAGHGGKDVGEKSGKYTEADITLDYAKDLKQSLESCGYKVKLTRDSNNTGTYTYTNMYDENGRISIACKTKAKLMISLHINNGKDYYSGFEIYSPCKSNLEFANFLASKIKEHSNIKYSNSNDFKVADGVYLRNFTSSEIKSFKQTANKKGYEPYNITKETPYLYTIREVGGIATGAYVDGRNKQYSKNEYFDSNQGIECYQLEMGYIKTDLETLITEKQRYVEAITKAISEKY